MMRAAAYRSLASGASSSSWRRPKAPGGALSTLADPCPFLHGRDEGRGGGGRSGPGRRRRIAAAPPPPPPSPAAAAAAAHRMYSSTARPERGGPVLAMGLGAAALALRGGAMAVRSWKDYQAEAERAAEEEAERRKEAGLPPLEEEEEARRAAGGGQDKAEAGGGGAGGGSASDDGPRENVFAKFFDMGVGSKFYEGGFEDTMTRKEAALILGVRESSTAKRIKEAHRKLLVLNHPDTGGSTHLSGKINEAKELLLKGKKGR